MRFSSEKSNSRFVEHRPKLSYSHLQFSSNKIWSVHLNCKCNSLLFKVFLSSGLKVILVFFLDLQSVKSKFLSDKNGKTVHVLSLLKLFPGLHILVHKIYLENFHIMLKCGKCQNNRQTTQTSVDLLGLLTVYALEHWVEVHIIPFLASCVILPVCSIAKKGPLSHSVWKSSET